MFSNHTKQAIHAAATGMFAIATAWATDAPKQVQGNSGIVVFKAVTNMAGIEVSGKSGTLAAQAEVTRDANQLVLHRLEATVPVKSLATGMKVRDEHMRKYVFTTADGQMPDLRFAAEEGRCEAAEGGHGFECALAGAFTLRGVTKPMTINLHVKDEGDTFKANSDALVRLSTYGITPPSQFGVSLQDDVKIHLEFSVKSVVVSASAGGPR